MICRFCEILCKRASVNVQVLQERGESTSRHGRATFSVLLFQDLAVVVLLILIPLLSPNSSKGGVSSLILTAQIGVRLDMCNEVPKSGNYKFLGSYQSEITFTGCMHKGIFKNGRQIHFYASQWFSALDFSVLSELRCSKNRVHKNHTSLCTLI